MRTTTILVLIASLLLILLGLVGCAYFLGKRAAAVAGGSTDVSPDGTQLVFSTYGDLYLLNLQTKSVSQLTDTPEGEGAATFSPDGKSIAYVASTPGEGLRLFIRSLDGKNVQQLTNESQTSDSAPSFSPDGAQIVFARAHTLRARSMGGKSWNDWDLYLINSDGTGVRRLTEQKYYQCGSPQFFKDGKEILFSAHVDRPTSLFKVSADGRQAPQPFAGMPEKEARMGAFAAEPDVSPDGSQIAFISDRAEGFAYDLYLMKSDGSDPRPLGIVKLDEKRRPSFIPSSPIFMPDGRSILFQVGGSNLWQVDIDGRNLRKIADRSLFTEPLKWHPKQ